MYCVKLLTKPTLCSNFKKKYMQYAANDTKNYACEGCELITNVQSWIRALKASGQSAKNTAKIYNYHKFVNT